MLLEGILEGIDYKILQGNIALDIAGVEDDSRFVKPGWLFVCISGFKQDGHDYIEQAIENGATAVVVQREVEVPDKVTVILTDNSRSALGRIASSFYGNDFKDMKIVGITGTNGKTTTSYIINNIIRTAGRKPGMIGTIEYKIGDDSRPASRTTPDSLEIHRLLSEMAEAGTDVAVMEVSSHALDLARVDELAFDVVVFTNLTQDHLDYHDSLEDYFKAKARLFTKKNNHKRKPYFCVNIDDEYGRRLIEMIGNAEFRFGTGPDADVMASDIKISQKGTTFRMRTPQGIVTVTSNLSGSFNVYNIMAACSVGLALDLSLEEIIRGVSEELSVSGRFESVDCGQGFLLVVDYAHTPDGLRNVLTLARELAGGHRIITVFGCGGDRDKAKRPQMGKVVSQLSDYFIITSDNPRSEEPISIIDEISAGIVDDTGFKIEIDRRKAIEAAIMEADDNDVVIIAGKGHEAVQEFKDRIIPFSDKDVCMEILKEKGFCKE